MNSKLDKSIQANNAESGKKRAYVKPSFRQETVFEVMALACGKIAATGGPCAANRKTS